MDDKPRGKGGRKGINWLAVRTFYFGDPARTYADCAVQYKVSARSVETVASREGWADERNGILGEAQGQLRKEALTSVVASLAAQADLTDEMQEALLLGLRDLKDVKWSSQRSRAETLKVYAEAADKIMRLGRDVRGIRAGESSQPQTGSDDPFAFYVEEQEVEEAETA